MSLVASGFPCFESRQVSKHCLRFAWRVESVWALQVQAERLMLCIDDEAWRLLDDDVDDDDDQYENQDDDDDDDQLVSQSRTGNTAKQTEDGHETCWQHVQTQLHITVL
eukprot:2904301-Amphidinium_carterae.1